MEHAEKYHMQKADREIQDLAIIEEILQKGQIVTIATSKNNHPYLFTLNYHYNSKKNCFYFHCAQKGKKIDYLEANAEVWGQVLEDRGYIKGECSHSYRTVHFLGKAQKITEEAEKRQVLKTMITVFEEDPTRLVEKYLVKPKKLGVSIWKIEIQKKWGKENNK